MLRQTSLLGALVVGGIALGQSSAGFQEQLSDYLKLRKTAVDQLPKLKSTSSAEALTERQGLVAAGIQMARAGAAQGTIFTPEVAQEFRQFGKQAMEGRKGKRVRRSLAHSEPVQATIRVNQPYPRGVPLQSMPPTLLKGLPKLPKELEYRLVSRTLVLRDVEANLIVDYLPEAIP